MTGQIGRADLPETRRGTDLAWFRAFFQTYHSVMVTAAYNRLGNRADAEEAAAEVFRIAWDRRETLRAGKRLAWLYATLRNVVGNEYRRRERSERRHEHVMNDLHAGADRSDKSVELSDRLEVRDAIATLPLSDRELIWMAYWEELTREEIAEVLGCSVVSVRVKLHRARARLKAVLHHLALQGRGGEFHA